MDKPKILIVDDREENIIVLEEVLRGVEAEFESALSGREAIDKFKACAYAVILLDVQMPTMNGFEVAKYMFENPEIPSSPIIFVTALSKEDKYVFEGYQSGAVDYLFKPLDPKVVRSKVSVFLKLFKEHQVLKLAREKADLALQAKSKFLYTMSHELRTPLNAILGFSTLLDTRLAAKEDHELAGMAKTIHRSGKHLLGLINDILDISKIEAQCLKLSYSEFDLNDLLAEIVSYTEILAQDHRNSFEVLNHFSPSIIHFDYMRLKQCLLNFISNACKFTQDGRIELVVASKTVANKEWLSFRITDTGIGMTEGQQKVVFDQFTQADDSTTRLFGGTGLGLAITKEIASLMDGHVLLESTLGKGSTFYFEFPLPPVKTTFIPALALDLLAPSGGSSPSIGHTKQSNETASQELLQVHLKKRTVLVVDDNVMNAELLKTWFVQNCFDVILAAGGEACLSLALQENPNLIVMDINMPGMDGWEAIKRLRSDTKTEHFPVIAVTADVRENMSLKCKESGFNGYLPKPIDFELFSRLVEDVLA